MPATIDDFSTGLERLDYSPGGAVAVTRCQAGTMLGSGRQTYLSVAVDPRSQPAHLDTGSGFLNVSLGAEQYGRIEIYYGYGPDTSGRGCAPAPLTGANADFLSMGGGIRTKFNSISTAFGSVNFNVVAFTTAGGWAQAGINQPDSPRPSEVTFRFDNAGPSELRFGGPGKETSNFSNVAYIAFIFQVFGDLVVDSLEIV